MFEMTTDAPRNSAARAFMARTHRLLIGGDWTQPEAGWTIDVIDPTTEARLASVAAAGANEVDLAVKAARHAFSHGPGLA